MRTIRLTDEQASTLTCFLLMTTNYRKDELEACRKLSEEHREDGSVRFPQMESNARWWEKANAQLTKIQRAIDEAPYEKEKSV